MKGEIKMSNNDKDKLIVLDDEKEILLDHDYDGIHELNHPLPSWWLVIFYLTMIFAGIYYIYYTFMGGPTLMDEYKEEVAIVEKAKAEWDKKNNSFDLDKYNAFIVTAKGKKLAKKVYKRKCRACHGIDGGGGVGPNLADNYWLNGNGSIQEVYKVIDKGVVDKGMEAWGEKLSKEQLMAVTSYVMNFKGTTPESPKEAQGNLFE